MHVEHVRPEMRHELDDLLNVVAGEVEAYDDVDDQTDDVWRLEARKASQEVVFELDRTSTIEMMLRKWQREHKPADHKKQLHTEVSCEYQPRYCIATLLPWWKRLLCEVLAVHMKHDHRDDRNKAQSVHLRDERTTRCDARHCTVQSICELTYHPHDGPASSEC